jgi:hypothetical protein
MRTPSTPGYKEERSVGRREVDRTGVCIWHDSCHEAMSTLKQDCIDLGTNMKSKLEWKVFALFVTGAVTLTIAFVFFVAPMILDMSEAVTTIKVNQEHLMHEFAIKPIK